MIHYTLSVPNTSSHYIDVTLDVDGLSGDTFSLQLPAWRPGRYELGNFAKNLKRLEAFDGTGTALSYRKTSKDCWEIRTNGSDTLRVTYSYHTTEINAGNCYADESVLYVNPVHLCLYAPARMHETHRVTLDVPANFRIAGSLPLTGTTMEAASFDELADSPFVAGAQLQSDYYEVRGIRFWLHFNGECRPDFGLLKKEFAAFTETQLQFWGDFPVNEYHFIFMILPYRFYHGVEHQRSTVISLGPGYALHQGKTYEDLLGVSSHELFHTWNIKYIRPAEMLPYEFSKENYARTGFVYEGFTTYYGDLMLRASGVFTDEAYFNTLEERLHKHFHNYGRFNLSVADSSWDTWLDGYVPGAPYRKTSIYDEGNLVAFMLDVLIMKHSRNEHSLKDVCRRLYEEFGKRQKGYTEADIIRLCGEAAGVSLGEFFDRYVFGTADFEPMLRSCFDYLGVDMQMLPSGQLSERWFGFKTQEHGFMRKVSLVAPGSPAWEAGLGIGDEIVAVNGYTLKNDLNEWLNYFSTEINSLTVSSNGRIKTIQLNKAQSERLFFPNIRLRFCETTNSEQNKAARKWFGS